MAQDLPSTEFLFDFIYLDRPRVSSYFAQLFDGGVLTQTKQVSQMSEADSNRVKFGLTGTGAETTQTDTLAKSMERQYDAAWSLPINVINRLDELNFIHRDIKSTPIGQIALVKGTLRLFDIRMLKDMWKPLFQMISQQTHPKETNRKRKEQDALVELISKLPHALQMSLFVDDAEIWTTLDPQHMTINPDDIAFKHGASIGGDWMLLGIVDALPDGSLSDSTPAPLREMEVGMMQMLNGIREFLGRPYSAFGITPIAIFRPVRK